jgi:large subunit ribosomal protein L23
MKDLNIKPNNSLLRPRITEKAAVASERNNVYVFEVSKDATKESISDSIKESYKVTPVKVRVLSIPSKEVFVRGKWGVKKGGKKAYVYLKKGDKIEVM